MGVKLVALDIDGTLIEPAHYGHDHTPTPRVSAAVAALRESGIAVVLASGRMFPGTAKIARHLGLPGPVICQQGCSVHLLDGTMTHEFPIARAPALEIIDYARQMERAYEWFNPLRYIVSQRSQATDHYGVVSGITPEYRPDPENSGVTPTGVGVISSRTEANGIHRSLVSHHGEALHILDFPEVTVAVAPEANKGHALSLVCAGLGIDRHGVVAIGDSVNDAAMLAWAGLGVAMPHSDAYALDAADRVLEGREDALAVFLEHLAS
ncbi:MAG: HAD family phosphatase [Chloroflexi bacterium]|nr:HAD family phosphatase [Chloroflexota bacterium]